MIIFIALLIYNITKSSQWMIDSIIALVMISLFLLLSKKLECGKTEFILLILAFLIHNLGSFKFYEFENTRILAYDTIGHFLITLIFAYIIFNFIAKKFNIKTLSTITLIFLVVSIVLAFGVLIEIIEFSGYMILGEGEGILMAGPGDGFGPLEMYIDVVQDLIINTLGAILGALIYYYSRFKKY